MSSRSPAFPYKYSKHNLSKFRADWKSKIASVGRIKIDSKRLHTNESPLYQNVQNNLVNNTILNDRT